MNYKISALLLLMVVFGGCSQSQKDNAAKGEQVSKGVYFVNLKDGDKVKSPFIVQMGVAGMEVEPAGEYHEDKGHHHLIIDGTYVEEGAIVPKDETHIHFGKGQTEDTLSLSPGPHTLTLQFADGLHRSYGKEWSSTIKITVEQ